MHEIVNSLVVCIVCMAGMYGLSVHRNGKLTRALARAHAALTDREIVPLILPTIAAKEKWRAVVREAEEALGMRRP